MEKFKFEPMKYTNGGPEVKLFSKLDRIVFALLGVVVLAAVSWKIIDPKAGKGKKSEMVQSEQKNSGEVVKTKSEKTATASEVKIIEKWDMPAELKEISALCYVDEDRFLAVQDELGTVFIYNTAEKKIEKKVPFASHGDFEGIASKGNMAYVLRADGRIFEVDLDNSSPKAGKELRTSLTAKQNVEGICYDKDNDRLLLAIKDNEPNSKDYKGIYAFDLQTRKFIDEAVIKIDLKDPAFSGSDKKAVMPSAITIHPSSKDIYITDGPKSKLLILDKSGKVKRYITLGKEFAQPEGITFAPGGELYISNEGTKQPGNIIQVELSEN